MAQPQFDVEKFFAPSKALASLAINNTERLVALNIELFTKYNKLAMDNAKEALTVADMEGAKAYLEKQSEVANNVVESLVADAQVVADLGKEYSENVQKVITEEVNKLKAA